MLKLCRKQRLWLWLALGLLLRISLIVFPRSLDDDTAVYLQLGRNLLHHHIYGMTGDSGVVSPSLFRLPGYPVFLALLGGNLYVVEIVQSVFGLLGCWLLASAVRSRLGERAAEWTLALGSLCLFTAAYDASALTESLSVFAMCWGIYAFARWSARTADSRATLNVFALAGAAALAMLMRPDGTLLLAAVLLAMLAVRTVAPQRRLRDAAVVCVMACLPLGVWAARNAVTFHVFQPLAPRYANDPGEFSMPGFNRWARTWSAEFVDTGTVMWSVGVSPLDVNSLPARAFDSEQQRAETAQLIAEYNRHLEIGPALDARFGELAEQRVRVHPVRYYAVVPAMRVADMMFRPRTAAFNIDVFWWLWRDHPRESAVAVAFALLNFAYFGLALAGCVRGRVPFAALLGTYFVLRCLLLATLESPEPRYSLELYPLLFIAAAVLFVGAPGDRGSVSAGTPPCMDESHSRA
jgi:hypothetical protein